MKVRFDEKKTIYIRNIIISEEEADKLLCDLKRVIDNRKLGKDSNKIRFGDSFIIISNLMEG